MSALVVASLVSFNYGVANAVSVRGGIAKQPVSEVVPPSQMENSLENVRRKERQVQQQDGQAAKADKYPIIAVCHQRLKQVFGKNSEHWYMDWKLWVGIAFWAAVWAKWLRYGYDEIYYQRLIFTFGINIWILHQLQYGSTTWTGMLVVCTAISVQTFFQTWIWWNAEEKRDDLENFQCDTLYLDLNLPGVQIGVLFVAQCGVWWFYMTSILGNFNLEEVNYLFMVWSYLIQMTMIFNRGEDSVLGSAFPVHDVHRLIKTASQITFVKLDVDDMSAVQGSEFKIHTVDVLLRGLAGYLCNSVLREIMAYTIPLMLMRFSEPMDFVVYSVGVNFICTLDDMSGVTYGMRRPEDLVHCEASDRATLGSATT